MRGSKSSEVYEGKRSSETAYRCNGGVVIAGSIDMINNFSLPVQQQLLSVSPVKNMNKEGSCHDGIIIITPAFITEKLKGTVSLVAGMVKLFQKFSF